MKYLFVLLCLFVIVFGIMADHNMNNSAAAFLTLSIITAALMMFKYLDGDN